MLAHERLAIVDVEHGAQPLVDVDGSLVLAVNGEIYNHRELRAALGAAVRLRRPAPTARSSSRCTRSTAPALADRLHGIFAFALVRPATGRLADRARSDRRHARCTSAATRTAACASPRS